jgi:hypothetical protein
MEQKMRKRGGGVRGHCLVPFSSFCYFSSFLSFSFIPLYSILGNIM